jgi:hypothetical protein
VEEAMFDSRLRLLIVSFLMGLAIPALAEDKCMVKAVLGGAAMTMKYCAVSLYDSEHSVLGFQNVYDLPKDKAVVNIEKLSGVLKLGGNLAGRITGGRMADGKKYSWEADFDMKLPATAAFGGQGCGN